MVNPRETQMPEVQQEGRQDDTELRASACDQAESVLHIWKASFPLDISVQRLVAALRDRLAGRGEPQALDGDRDRCGAAIRDAWRDFYDSALWSWVYRGRLMRAIWAACACYWAAAESAWFAAHIAADCAAYATGRRRHGPPAPPSPQPELR